MATASSEANLKCSICLETYKEPRKLPGCSHSFCEFCIVTFLHKLKAEDKLNLEFQCPVCRLPSESPKDKEDLREWVKKMDKDSELEARVCGDSENTGDESCDPCRYLKKHNEAKYFCLKCKECLCQGCSDILHAIKENRNHYLIEIKDAKVEQFHKPALELMSKLLTCSEHATNQIEFYCEDHGQAACYKCVTIDHRACGKVKDVQNMSQVTLKSSLAKINGLVTKQIDYIKQIQNMYKQNEDQNKINITTIHKEIQTIKQNIVKLFDSLEDNIKQNSNALMKSISLRNLEEIEDLKHLLQQLNVMDYLIKTCLASATLDQMFVCVEGLKRMFEDSGRKVIEKARAVKTTEVSLKVNDLLNSILQLGPNDTTQLAAIEEKKSITNIPTYKQHRTAKYVEFRDIVAKGRNSSPTYNNLLFLPNNDLLLVDSYDGYICLVNGQYEEKASRVFVSDTSESEQGNFRRLQYASLIENGKIAVVMCHDKKICVVSSADLSIIKTIDCKYIPKCMVSFDGNTIAIAWSGPVAFGIIEIQGSTYSDKVYFTTDNAGRNIKSFDYMAIDKDLRHVIQPCKVDKAVYCFTLDGEPVFTYKTDELKEPVGVAVDNDSNVYICDNVGGSIHVLSAFGLAVKVIKDSCPKRPLAISFSTKGDRFAVSEYNNIWERIHFFALVEDK